MQIKDFLGLQMAHVPEHYYKKSAHYLWRCRPLMWVMLHWHCDARYSCFLAASGHSFTGHLPALLAGCAVMGIVNLLGDMLLPSVRNSTTSWPMVLRERYSATAAATGAAVGSA